MSLRTDLRDEIRQLEANGWIVTKTSRGHWRCIHPEVATPIFTSGTPGDWRSVRNFRAEVKRALRSTTIEERPMPTATVSITPTTSATIPTIRTPWQPEIKVYRTRMDSKPQSELVFGAREAAHLGGLDAKVRLTEGAGGAWHLQPDPEGDYTVNQSGALFRLQCRRLAAVVPPTGRTVIPSEIDGAGFALFPGLVTPIAPNEVKQRARARARATVDVWNKEYRFPGPPTARTHAAVEAPPSTEVQSSRQPSLDDLRTALEMLRTIVTDLGAELYLDDAGIVRARIIL